MRKEDPKTKKIIHNVLDGYGNKLSPLDLERELPKFEDVELVDIGMKYPFYHDYMAGRTNASTGPNDKIAMQLSLIANHLVKHGDLSFLKTLWDSVGTVVHRQACFMDFNWTSRHLVNLFHHIFVVGLEDIGTSILNEGSYSLEFCCR